MAISGADRTAKSRQKKIIDTYIDDFLDGKKTIYIHEFIHSKEREFCRKYALQSVVFDLFFTKKFNETAQSELGSNHGLSYSFSSHDLFLLWNKLMKKRQAL